MKVAIIGAGPSGLALGKQLKDLSIEFVIYERDKALGGVWNINNEHSVMYHSAHTISSKHMTEFSEFPMPKEYPAYCSHSKMLNYLQNYSKHFDLEKYIQFNTRITHVEKLADGRYQITIDNEEKNIVDFVAIATGHVSEPRLPELNFADFSGCLYHTRDYKEPSVFKDKNVLIIGAGNSGCDIACEAIPYAKSVKLSLRRGYYFIPKFILGMPADEFGETSVKLRLPMAVRQKLNQIILRIYQGNIGKIGFPKPDHRIFESHPIVNELLVYYVRHGDITICQDVKKLTKTGVVLDNGESHDTDCIVLATGYKVNFSFLNDDLVPTTDNLHLNLFSKKHYGLCFLGFIDPNGGVLGLIEYQAKAAAKAMALNCSPDKYLSMIGQSVALNGGIDYMQTDRHQFEVDLSSYRKAITKQIKLFDKYSKA